MEPVRKTKAEALLREIPIDREHKTNTANGTNVPTNVPTKTLAGKRAADSSLGSTLSWGKKPKTIIVSSLVKKKKVQMTLFGAIAKEPVTKKASKRSGHADASSLADEANRHTVYHKEPYKGGQGLRVISQPQLMFDDMVKQQIPGKAQATKLLRCMIQKLQGRPLRVATMCSGTESPVLALDMLQQALRDFVEADDTLKGLDPESVFPLQHIFSCEIEPYKQAYIERNFSPPLLFRDIRELGRDQAYTAFGSLVDVPNSPGCVDVLIAGTSCVDYSNLNTKRKEIDDRGESGQTFFGMMDWISKAQPLIVIVENVYGAPWDLKVKLFEERGYSASYLKLDTKDFYIPHTRQRGYLFAVRKSTKKNALDKRPQQWKDLVSKLKRPASATLDEFMLPNDDPRVLRGRARLTSESYGTGGARAGRTDWTKCETRHQAARSFEELGDMRPFTEWSDSGNVHMPPYCWDEWMNAQVHRIHDLMDINTLRLAKVGIDPTYKPMVWNLSQNVDRDTMGTLGLCQCLTPTGVPYVTSRGGPLVGEELLLLQGIPADDLILTKETEDNLKDLAGNAMSTTVVGACTIAALLVAHKELCDLPVSLDQVDILPKLVPRPLVQLSDVTVSRKFGEYETQLTSLGPSQLPGRRVWNKLLSDAKSSSRLSVNEGTEEALPSCCLMVCKECAQVTSSVDADRAGKYEEHNFVPAEDTISRVQPSRFRSNLLDLLPMKVLVAFDELDALEMPSNVDKRIWHAWLQSVQNTIATPEDNPNEFRFTQLVRSDIWTAVYLSATGSGRLEARITETGVEWLLFAETLEKFPNLKLILEHPVARMNVEPISDDSVFDLLCGQWELRLPVERRVSLEIEGNGRCVASWRNRLGLKGAFESEVQHEMLQISVVDEHEELKAVLDGRYKLLPRCGGACGSLMKRVKADGSSKDQSDIFFFLSCGKNTLANDDYFVFAPSFRRTKKNEYNEILLELDPSFRLEMGAGMRMKKEKVHGKVQGTWRSWEAQAMTPTSGKFFEPASTQLTLPKSIANIPSHAGAWKVCPELVSCAFPTSESDRLFVQCMKAGGSLEVNLQKSKLVLEQVAFATSRLSLPNLFKQESWIVLDSSDCEKPCSICAPSKPKVKFTAVEKAGKIVRIPLEDGKEAARYERALKTRPQPWVIRFSGVLTDSSPQLTVQIGCNAVSLVQRALGFLPKGTLQRKLFTGFSQKGMSDCSFEWRVMSHVDKVFDGDFRPLYFMSNREDAQAKQPPNFSMYPLRKEQLRSLTWMLQQEASTVPFYEEEVCEQVLPSLNWRAEGRVRRPVAARAGIIADEVGYGKTCISLALIDSAESVNGLPPEPPLEYQQTHFWTKATLVIVPRHLLGQWPDEIKKFLGTSKNVLVLKDLNSINSLKIADIQSADIVVTSFAVLSNDKYFARLAHLSGRNPSELPSSGGGRQFCSVYDEILEGLGCQVTTIKNNCINAYKGITTAAKSFENEETNSACRLDGKKAVYKQGESAFKAKKSGGSRNKWSHEDPWGLSSSAVHKDFTAMKSPGLEMFFWDRVIVDEFTYLEKKEHERLLNVIHRFNASFKWFLSGTPRHQNFNDIQVLSNLMGIHLGVNEPLPSEKLNKKWLEKKESSGLESLSMLLESKSMQWHERRHVLAQSFLDRFVRQNVAEIDEIKFEEHDIVLELPPVERAIYLELETHLKSLDMNSKKALKSKKSTSGDRASRIQKILQDSETSEEALLKCCSHFNMSDDGSTAIKTIDDIIQLRQEEKKRLEHEMTEALVSAFRQRHDIVSHQGDWLSKATTGKGDVADALGAYLGLVETKKGVPHGCDEDIHRQVEQNVETARRKFEADPDGVNEKVIETPSDETSPKKKPKVSKRTTSSNSKMVAEEELFDMKQALRNHMHGVRSLAKEFCGRERSLRYIHWIRRLQKEPVVTCMVCNENEVQDKQVKEIGVLSCCGHVGCLECLTSYASLGKCIDPKCDARTSVAHVVPASKVGFESSDGGGKFGAKLSAIVEKTQSIIAETNDRLLVFCQFDDLKNKVKDALASCGVEALEVSGTVQQQIKTISKFQTEKPDKNDPRVLLLKMDDEQAAGLNLTTLNHAMFVHPLLAETQQEYDAYETQSIGRIRRFGQRKTVHVWRFLMRDTIDTEIYSQRAKRSLPSSASL